MQMVPRLLYPFLYILPGLFMGDTFSFTDFILTMFELCIDIQSMNNVIYGCPIRQRINHLSGNIFYCHPVTSSRTYSLNYLYNSKHGKNEQGLKVLKVLINRVSDYFYELTKSILYRYTVFDYLEK